MTFQEAVQLRNGVYRIHWKESQGGGTSVASIGRNYSGMPWIAPANWTFEKGKAVQSLDSWEVIDHVELIATE